MHDSRDQSGLAVVRVIRDELTLTPATASIAPGEVVTLRVGGGTAPYAWSTEAGSLDTLEGSVVRLVAPDEPGRYRVTVSDGREVSGRAVVVVGAALPGQEGCGSGCGAVESRMEVAGVVHSGSQAVADEGADLGLQFRVQLPDDGQRHQLYAVAIWSPPDDLPPMIFFRVQDPVAPFLLWSEGPFPAWGEAQGGEERMVDLYTGPSTGLSGVFDFYLGFAPDGDIGQLIHNAEPYRLELGLE